MCIAEGCLLETGHLSLFEHIHFNLAQLIRKRAPDGRTRLNRITAVINSIPCLPLNQSDVKSKRGFTFSVTLSSVFTRARR